MGYGGYKLHQHLNKKNYPLKVDVYDVSPSKVRAYFGEIEYQIKNGNLNTNVRNVDKIWEIVKEELQDIHLMMVATKIINENFPFQLGHLINSFL